MTFSEDILKKIRELCLQNGVKSLDAFGSVTRSDFHNESDIDLLVDFNEQDPIRYTDLYFTLKEQLEALLNRQIDLVEARSVRNSFFKKELEKTKFSIYG